MHLVECVSELWPLKVFLSPHPPTLFIFFFSLFRWDRGLDLRNTVSPGGIKLWASFSSREQAFVIKIAQGTFHNGYFSSPFAGARKGCFLALQYKKLVESLEVKTDESIQVLLRLCSQEFLTQASAHSALGNSSKLPFKCCYQFWLQ